MGSTLQNKPPRVLRQRSFPAQNLKSENVARRSFIHALAAANANDWRGEIVATLALQRKSRRRYDELNLLAFRHIEEAELCQASQMRMQVAHIIRQLNRH